MKDAQSNRMQRVVYILMPLVLLIVCLAGINLVTWWNNRPVATTAVSPAASAANEVVITETAPTPSRGQAVSPTLPPATATATPQPTPTTQPTLPPNAQISLQGPPVDSTLFINQPITFYWQWPVELPEGNVLTLYLLTDDAEIIVGSQSEPNLGIHYQLQLTPDQFNLAPQAIQWQVRLSNQLGEVLLVSEKRPFTLLPSQ